MPPRFLVAVLASLVLIVSCGSDTSQSVNPYDPPAPVSNPDIKILMMGNSHTAPIPKYLRQIFQRNNPSLRVLITQAPGGMFLIDRMNDPANVELLRDGDWTHVVLQALKYSTSGQYEYPTLGAEFFIDLSNEVGTTPILFPEHPRKGNSWESSYLYQLHSSIAEQHPACVSPIGFVWEDFMSKSSLSLHMQDGNHASAAGSFLTALVIYQTIMAVENFQSVQYIQGVGLSQSEQALMRTSVADITASYIPCNY